MSSEAPSVYADERRKARKPHRCCECGGVIESGETYQHFSGIWDGKAARYKTCPDCVDLRDDVNALAAYVDERPAFRELGDYCFEEGEGFGRRFEAIRDKRAPK